MEVERVLRGHPALEEVAVVGEADEKWGEVGHAFIIVKEGAAITIEEILSYCDGRLARYKWPKKMTVCDDFPRTTLGKIRKALLVSNKAPGEELAL